jgi:hypothetical protein
MVLVAGCGDYSESIEENQAKGKCLTTERRVITARGGHVRAIVDVCRP